VTHESLSNLRKIGFCLFSALFFLPSKERCLKYFFGFFDGFFVVFVSISWTFNQPSIMLFLVLTIFTSLLAYLLLQKRFKFWDERGFVSAATSAADFPFGNMKGVGTKMPSFKRFDELYNSFKGKAQVLGMYMFVSPTLMILDLELLKNVFIRDFASFHDRGFYSNKKDDPMSANLVNNFLL
jgi:hypothetical protein